MIFNEWATEFVQPSENEEYLFNRLRALEARVCELENRTTRQRLIRVYLFVRDILWRLKWRWIR